MAKLKFPTKPKAPAAGASAKQHEAYHEKLKIWADKVRSIKEEQNRQAAAAAKTAQAKAIKVTDIHLTKSGKGGKAAKSKAPKNMLAGII